MEFLSWFIPLLASVAALAILCALSLKHKEFSTEELCLAAVCLGLSFALSYIKLYSMPSGGSITPASLVPVCLFAYIYGVRHGLLVGIIYGWMQMIQGVYMIHPVQVLLDYILAFSCVALCGLFYRKDKGAKYYDLLLGLVVAGVGRFLCSSLAGVYFWGSAWWASFVYNSVILVDIAIAVVVCAYLQYSKDFRTLVEKERAKINKPQEREEEAASA